MIPRHYINSITAGDCRELLPTLPDQCAAFAFADPPYWVGYDYGHSTDEDMEFINPVRLVTELQRVASVVCVTTGMRHLWDYPKPDWVLGWFKPGSTRQSGVSGFNVWEPILLYGKPKRGLWQDAINLPDVANHAKEASFHKCPKPVRLLQWLIEGLTQPGDLVIDPVAGSGTTGVVCKQTGRDFIGFEIDPDTATKARTRIANTQPPLFTLAPQQTELDL